MTLAQSGGLQQNWVFEPFAQDYSKYNLDYIFEGLSTRLIVTQASAQLLKNNNQFEFDF